MPAGSDGSLRARPLELAMGTAWGTAERIDPLPTRDRPQSARHGLEQAVRRALLEPPCFVSFSGGRDSSTVLAVAEHLARQEGHPPPIPITLRFIGFPDTDEREWQEAVLHHLRITRHEVIEIRDELGLLGPHATADLIAHGVRLPANTYVHRPVFEMARGGTVLTGIGGDEFFLPRGWATAQHFIRDRPWAIRPAVQFGLSRSPRWVRWPYNMLRDGTPPPWLRPAARGRALASRAWAGTAHPVGWAAATAWYWESRALQVPLTSIAAAASEFGVGVVHPFADPEALSIACAWFGNHGPASRSAGLQEIAGDLLPTSVIERGTKAVFAGPIWDDAVRAFIARWNGDGIDRSIVSPARLRRHWMDGPPDIRSAALLQLAYLSSISH